MIWASDVIQTHTCAEPLFVLHLDWWHSGQESCRFEGCRWQNAEDWRARTQETPVAADRKRTPCCSSHYLSCVCECTRSAGSHWPVYPDWIASHGTGRWVFCAADACPVERISRARPSRTPEYVPGFGNSGVFESFVKTKSNAQLQYLLLCS